MCVWRRRRRPACSVRTASLWLDRLERELDNFRVARRWFVSAGDTDAALRLASALYRLWMYRGFADEGSASLAEALAMPGGSPAAHARALFCRGGLGVTIIQTDYASAQRYLEDSVIRLREVGDVEGCAWALMGAGAAASMRGDVAKAESVLAEARQVSLVSGATAVLALSYVWSGDLAYAQGDFATARAFAEQALHAADSIGFAVPACMALTTLGNLSWLEGELETAEGQLESAVLKAEQLDEAYPIVWAAISLALLAADRGHLERARALLAKSIGLARRDGNRHHVAQTLEGLAAFAAMTRQPEAAMRFAGAAATVRTQIGARLTGTELDLLERRLEPVRRELDARAAQLARQAGATWSIEHATRLALEFTRDCQDTRAVGRETRVDEGVAHN